MRVKKRVKKGVKKGIKRVKSAPPEAYLAGSGVLVGAAAVLLLATTKRGQELLIRTAQLALHPAANELESQEADVPEEDEQEFQESDVQEDVRNEAAEDADIEEEPEDEADIEEEPEDEADIEEEPEDEADIEEEPEEDADGDEESKVTDLKPRDQRPRSAAPGRRPRSSTRTPSPAES
jgi:flavin-dependent dehydrogenase